MKLKIDPSSLLKHIFLWSVSCHTLCEAAELVYGIENEIKDYNISRSIDKNAFSLAELVTEGLFYQRPDGSLAPDLVKEFKRVGKIWTFRLRSSRFSNGKSLTCADVQANIEEARNSPRPVKFRLRDIASVKCEGDLLRIETNNESPQLIGRIGAFIRIYEISTLNDKNPVGSGAYVIRQREGKDLILTPNPYHAPATFERIRFRSLRDPWLRDLALFAGNVDFLLENFSLPRLQAYQLRKDVKVYRNPGQTLFYLVLKASRFSKEQRQRLKNILYKENVVGKFWGEEVQPAHTIFDGTVTKEEKIALPTDGPPFQVEVSAVADETQLNFLRAVAKTLAPYNIILKLRPLEFVSYMKRLNTKNFDAYFFYVDTSHPQNLEALLSSRGNRLDIADPELDQAFLEIAKTDNPARLSSLELKLEDRVSDEIYLIPLYRAYHELVSSSRLRFQQSTEGFWRDLLNSHKVE